MNGKIRLMFKYLQYWLGAANGQGHGIHSPFVYTLIREVLNDKQDHAYYPKQKGLYSEKSLDLKYLQLMARLVRYLNAKKILLLSSNKDQTIDYIHAASNQATLNSLEINPDIKTTLQTLLKQASSAQSFPSYDFMFLDVTMQPLPDGEDLQALFSCCHEHTCFVISHIHGHEDSEKLWNNIKEAASVTITIDLFHVGLVLFRKEKRVAEHFSIRF